MAFERQVPLTVRYKEAVGGDCKADYVVAKKVLLELKAMSALHALHEAQILNYLAATGLRVGPLLNFGGRRLEFKRFVK